MRNKKIRSRQYYRIMKLYGVQTEHIVNHMEGTDSKILCLSEENYNKELSLYTNYPRDIRSSFICTRDLVYREGKLVCHLDYITGNDKKVRIKVYNNRLFDKHKESIVLYARKVGGWLLI